MSQAKEEMERLSLLLEQGLDVLREASTELAHAEFRYRKERGVQWAKTADQKLVVAERDARVDAETAEQRLERDLAEGKRQSALEAVRSRRQQLSAWQSWIAAERAEAELTRVGHLYDR